MDEILDILKYLLSGIVVFGTAFYILKLYLDSEQKRKMLDNKSLRDNIIIPLRLQAYERLILFLERISFNNLLARVYDDGLNVIEFRTLLVENIKKEFEHNLSQQLYVSSVAWNMVVTAKENVIKIINTSSAELDEKADSKQLFQKIIENTIDNKKDLTIEAIEFIKNEVRRLF